MFLNRDTSSHFCNTIIRVTELCIEPFPKVNQIKGALKKVEKVVYQNQSSLHKKHSKNQYIQSVLFYHSISLNKSKSY